jgi:hypothetical protein
MYTGDLDFYNLLLLVSKEHVGLDFWSSHFTVRQMFAPPLIQRGLSL